jgi:acetylornithine deacetylase
VESPFTPVVRDGRLHGRGAGDMKGSLAAIMLVGAAAVREGFRGDVVVTAVADEEVGSIGTEDVVRRLTADAAIVAEPTEEVVAIAHKGFVAFEIETEGNAAHGSRPDLGVDAISAMGPVLSGIAALDARLRSGPGHPLLGTGSLHASVIEGGQEYSSYPAHCLLLGERRTIPGETVDDVRVELEAICEGTGASVRLPFHRPPFETGADASVVTALLRHLGHDRVGGVAFWADSALLAGAGIPTVVFGPVVGGIHGVDEWVDLASLERCHDAYLAVARELCA